MVWGGVRKCTTHPTPTLSHLDAAVIKLLTARTQSTTRQTCGLIFLNCVELVQLVKMPSRSSLDDVSSLATQHDYS